jgi:hypothetical protein
MIVEWDSVAFYPPSTSTRNKFQVIIYDTTRITPTGDNEILVQYMTANSYNGATVGIEDQTGTIGIQCLYNGTYHRAAAPINARSAIKYTTCPPQINPGVEESEPNYSIDKLALFANQPNPFSKYTLISYSLPHASNVHLEIFDVTGRLIQTLKDSKENAGVYTVRWDGRDNNGSKVANGIYFCRLRTDNATVIRKLTIIK